MRALILMALAVCSRDNGFGQSFEVASVKPSLRTVGKDAMTPILITATGLTGRNTTLKRLIVQAYAVQSYQVSGGPGWLDESEYDIEAKAGGASTREQLALMLQALLTERFHLAVHRESKELRVHELVVDKGGPKIHPVPDGQADDARAGAGNPRNFRGSLQAFADLLAVQLSIPLIDDPGRPSIASGAPVPVVDKTDLVGIFAFSVSVKPESGVDMLTLWQRVLQAQLGLKLESRKTQVGVLVVDRAEKAPTPN